VSWANAQLGTKNLRQRSICHLVIYEGAKMNLKTLIQRHPLAAYFGLAYAITWGGSFLIAGPTRLSGSAISAGQFILVWLMMLAGPSTASLLLTATLSGREGLRELWARMSRWRVQGRWYAVAVLTTPLVLLGVLYTLAALTSPAYRPGFNIFFGIAVGGLAGFFEEIGWSGFATTRLLQKQSGLAAGLLLGILWGSWHMMAGWMGSTPGQELFWLADFLLFWVLTNTAYRILMTWVYSKTTSVLVAQIMHAFWSGTFATLLPVLAQAQTLVWEAIFAACIWGLVFMLAIADRKPQVQRTVQPQAVS
jgi:membrane protease YdiL (CAAX protease family)